MTKKIFISCFLLTSFLLAQDIRVKYKTLQLSYMTTDRVGGILKSLGYAVVDFEKSPGVNPNESILTPTGDFANVLVNGMVSDCLLYTSPSPRDGLLSRMPSSA